MKKLLVIALLTSFSSSSFAIHAYRSMECENSTHKLTYKGSHLVGGAWGLSRIGEDTEVELFEADGESDNTFKIEFLNSKIISETETSAVCAPDSAGEYDFSESTSESIDMIKILRLESAEEAVLQLKTDSILEMKCIQNLSIPEKCE